MSRSNQYHNGAGTMWSAASHGLRRTLAYLGGRLVRQNAIRTPPKCPPTYLRSRVGAGSWGKWGWAFQDEAMTMFEEGLSQHCGEGNWCRALDAHTGCNSSRVWVYAATGARPRSFISTFYPERDLYAGLGHYAASTLKIVINCTIDPPSDLFYRKQLLRR